MACEETTSDVGRALDDAIIESYETGSAYEYQTEVVLVAEIEYGPTSMEAAMLHCHVSTGAQRGQTKHWLWRVSSPELLMTTVPFYMFIVILMYRFKFQYMNFATCSGLELHKFSPRSQTSLLTSESKSRTVSTSYDSLHSNMKQLVYL